jgi:Flp pilus assembly protein TadD
MQLPEASMRRRQLPAAWLVVLALVGPAAAVDDGPVPEPAAPTAPSTVSPERRYNEGLALARQRDWRGAEGAYRDALRARPTLAEAWNGLGYALRHQARYEESVRAYQEALRLRPVYPEALEYLGEAYVQMGRMADARRLLQRLRELGAPEAEDLARAIGR